MGRRTRAFLTWLWRERRHEACLEGDCAEAAASPREPGSLLPDRDPLCTSLRGPGPRIVHADVARDFELRQADVLGTGCSGSVLLAEHRLTRQRVAVKTFLKSKLKGRQLERLQQEVSIGLQVDHPNVCRLLHVYEKGDKVWLVMELCGSDLFERIKKDGAMPERKAREAVRQMLRAVAYMHKHNMVHRDIKLENWMYGLGDGPETLKLIDFGFSTRLDAIDEVMTTPCGTLHYVSPEVLKQKYTAQTDMWSMGVVSYILLTGRMPFSGPQDTKIAQDIQLCKYRREGRWCALPALAQDFVRKLLVKDPAERMTAEQALQHPWIMDGEGPSTPRPLLESQLQHTADSILQFGQGSQLRRAALRALACLLPSSELCEAERLFLELQTEASGRVSGPRLCELLRAQRPEVEASAVEAAVASLELRDGEDISYSSFAAAMLSRRSDMHTSKVRALFSFFDVERTGFLTARGLRLLFSQNPADQPPATADRSALWLAEGLSQAQAEAWIAEVDYRGNGVVDFDGFTLALAGELRVPPALREDAPDVRVFEASEGQAEFPEVSHCAASSPWGSVVSTREPSVISYDDFSDSPMSSWSKGDLVGTPFVLDSYFPDEFQFVGFP